MISQIKSGAFLGAVLAATAIAGPVAVQDIQVVPALQERSSIALGTYSLATSHENDVIIGMYVIVLSYKGCSELTLKQWSWCSSRPGFSCC
jgi:hypothetical protein